MTVPTVCFHIETNNFEGDKNPLQRVIRQQNLTLVVISHEINETRRRPVS